MLICDKCKAGIVDGAKFCPQCGDPVTSADKVNVLVKELSVANVKIIFGQSSSSNYSKAVAICENIPSHKTIKENKQIQHIVDLPITEVDLLVNLYDLVSSWKSSQMLINGHVATKKELTYYGVGCFRNRQKSFKPEQYCFGEKDYEANIWGCKRLNMPINEWGGGWLDYGQFDNSGLWHLDKPRIKHSIELGLKENELCPVLDRKRILETVDQLPNVIDPNNDENWQYRTTFEEVKGEYKEVAVGIRPVIKKVNRYVIGSYKPYWESTVHQNTSQNNQSVKSYADNLNHPIPTPSTSYSWVWIILFVISGIYLFF